MLCITTCSTVTIAVVLVAVVALGGAVVKFWATYATMTELTEVSEVPLSFVDRHFCCRC
jgi:hypothetical protein